MTKQSIAWGAALGCGVLASTVVLFCPASQAQNPPLSHPESQALSLEGPAIHQLITLPLPGREIRNLVTDAQTARKHPDLAAYYRSEAHRQQIESEKYERFARAAGDPAPLDAPNHFGISRTARFDYLAAKSSLRQSRNANMLAALHQQAAQKQGCFMCHSLNGQGSNIAPDLALEGSRGRTDAWLVSHFKDPQSRSAGSVMPAFRNIPDRQLYVLATYLQNQKPR